MLKPDTDILANSKNIDQLQPLQTKKLRCSGNLMTTVE